MCLAGAVLVSWSLKQGCVEALLTAFTVITNIFVTE